MEANHPLAIVIPAYKSEFLAEVLDSIERQSCRDFNVYIGDDASPKNIADVVRQYSGRLPIQYRRFERNLGRESLVMHWKRCIDMSHEPWVWLFSDDDVMDAYSVERFYLELEATEACHDLYRFNTMSIDARGAVLSENPTHPQNETGADFLVARLRGGRTSTAQELIFARSAWKLAGGFPDFPLAWASDDAFTAILGSSRPIRVIPDAKLKWRLSGSNISSDESFAMAIQKLEACREFVQWAAVFLKEHPPTDGPLTVQEVAALLEEWFYLQMINRNKLVNFKSSLEVDRLASSSWHHPRGYGFLKTMKFNYNLACDRIFSR